MWGKVCSSCSFCLSVSTATVFQDEGSEEEFCSDSCRSKHSLLLSQLLKCDCCGLRGRLSESLPQSGEVKRFCDLKCLLQFCRNQEQLVDPGSTPPTPAGPNRSSPVITGVVSLSSALRDHLNAMRASPQLGLFTDIQAKVVGHAGVQTDLKELKNKSTLCVPLVHNKGVSCSVQTVETAAQTVVFKEKVREKLLPIPVPIFVPLPMNLYSQYTPTLLPLPVPLPVPVFLSDRQSSSEPPEEAEEEETCREPVEMELPLRPAEGAEGDETTIRQDGEELEEAQQTLPLVENISSYRDQFETDLNQKQVVSDSILNLFFETQPPKIPPKSSAGDVPAERLPAPAPPPPPAQVMQNHMSPSNPSPPLTPAPSQETAEEDHNETTLTNGETPQPSAAEEEPSAEGSPPMVPRKKKELSGQIGVDAWRRWMDWRGSQTDLAAAATLKADPLQCSSSELNVGLCLFIKEARRQRGGPRSADAVFYLCLCIQQHLLENGRHENIFSDPSYQKFSSRMTRILKRFRASVSAAGPVRSCVQEEFLWGCKQLGAYSPLVLLNTLLFFCCKHFGFTTVEQHRQLSFAFFIRCTKTNPDSTRTTYLHFYPPTSTNQEESDSDGVPAKKRRLKEKFLKIKENKKNPLRCPVKLYEFYLSKCSESVRRRSDLFYLQPSRRCLPSNPVWFSMTPLDDATMEAMMVRSLAVRPPQKKK